MKTCFVFLYPPDQTKAVPAGILAMSDSSEPSGTFVYGRRYLQRPECQPVDPVLLPLRPDPILLTPGHFGAIRDAAPDYWGRCVLEYAKNVTELHEMDYLLDENACRIGNLDFRVSPLSPEPAFTAPYLASLEDLAKAAEAIDKERPDAVPEKILILLQQGSSIGGARPKTTVIDDEEMWIAKFPAKDDKWSNARVEAAAMRLAALCGVTIPVMRIVRLGKKDVLLARRFDRDFMEHGWARKGYLSGLSLADWNEFEHERFSYLTLADKMRELGAAGQLEELFRRMVFNILCRNTDDHPRNHGFFHQGATLSISPAFDITPTPCTPGVGTMPNLAMAVGMRGKEASRENALSVCARFGLESEEASNIVLTMTQTCLSAWEETFGLEGVSAKDKARFAHTFERWGEHAHP